MVKELVDQMEMDDVAKIQAAPTSFDFHFFPRQVFPRPAGMAPCPRVYQALPPRAPQGRERGGERQ